MVVLQLQFQKLQEFLFVEKYVDFLLAISPLNPCLDIRTYWASVFWLDL